MIRSATWKPEGYLVCRQKSESVKRSNKNKNNTIPMTDTRSPPASFRGIIPLLKTESIQVFPFCDIGVTAPHPEEKVGSWGLELLVGI